MSRDFDEGDGVKPDPPARPRGSRKGAAIAEQAKRAPDPRRRKPERRALPVHERLVFRPSEQVALDNLTDYALTGLYVALKRCVDFETGEVPPISYLFLEGAGKPRPPQQGRPRSGPTKDVVRRMLADLEAVGLVKRNASANEKNAQLNMTLPHVRAAFLEWKKRNP